MSRQGQRRVYLHIGAPKTGTTYLQDRLTLNLAALRKHGVVLPSSSPLVPPTLFHFRAALDVLEQDWGGRPGHSSGAWNILVRRLRSNPGTAIVTHEIFAPARPKRIERIIGDLRGLADTEVHLVYSARDLARQLPAAWQESIKQGRTFTFRRFLDRVERGKTWFYQAFDLPNVLDKWTRDLPADRVHVVTVPQRAAIRAEPDAMWLRMCAALNLDPAWAPRDSPRLNQSLGAAETEVIRLLNRRMDPVVRRRTTFDELIREQLAQEHLVSRSSIPVMLPPHRFDWVEEQAQTWIDALASSGVHVIGDVEELRPVRPAAEEVGEHPGKVRNKAKLDAAVAALAAMTSEAARRTDPERTKMASVRSSVERWRDR